MNSPMSVYARTDAEVEEVDDLHEIKLDRQGYADLGQYYGHIPGVKIYEYRINFKLQVNQPSNQIRQYRWFEMRAPNRKTIREHLKKQYPNAKICR